jgi:hypothetical protein
MPALFVPVGLAPAGMALLLDAFDCARDAGSSPWNYAVEMSNLVAAGVSDASLHWLIAKNYAEHGVETTLPSDDRHKYFHEWLT